MPTAIVHHPVFEKHDTGPHHPEMPERYRVTIDALRADHELWSNAIEIEADEARRSDIQACHTPQHFKHVEEAVREGRGYLDADTMISGASFEAAMRGAGAACRAIDAVMDGTVQNAFVPLRAMTPATDERRAFESAIEEIGSKFSPDLIIISAGFDAHQGDPLGQLLLTDEDFVQMTRVVKDWAKETCGGRLISCMEGGYNLETLGETVRQHVRELQNAN